MKHFAVSSTSADAYRRWAPNRPTTPEMQELMDAVTALLDAGMFYTSDVYAAIVRQFDFTDSELMREKGRVENGAIGMDIYYARKRVEEQRLAVREKAAREALAPVPGKKLGALRFPGMQSTLRNCHIVHSEGEVIIEGAAGNRRKQFRTNCLAIEGAMKRAAKDRSGNYETL